MTNVGLVGIMSIDTTDKDETTISSPKDSPEVNNNESDGKRAEKNNGSKISPNYESSPAINCISINVDLGRLKKYSYLGKGSFARVYQFNNNLAIKVTDQDCKNQHILESAIIRRTQHPNIIAPVSISRDYIALPLALGDLYHIDCSFMIELVIYQVISGLAYLHSLKIMHRDIKPNNLLLFADGQIKITDFGLAMIYAPSLIRNNGEEIVTSDYRAPELLLDPDGDYGYEIDLWAAGITIWHIALHHYPFRDLRLDGDFDLLLNIFHELGSPLLDSESNSNSDDGTEGIVWPGVVNLPYWSDYLPNFAPNEYLSLLDLSSNVAGVIRQLIRYDPKKRAPASTIMFKQYLFKSTEQSSAAGHWRDPSGCCPVSGEQYPVDKKYSLRKRMRYPKSSPLSYETRYSFVYEIAMLVVDYKISIDCFLLTVQIFDEYLEVVGWPNTDSLPLPVENDPEKDRKVNNRTEKEELNELSDIIWASLILANCIRETRRVDLDLPPSVTNYSEKIAETLGYDFVISTPWDFFIILHPNISYRIKVQIMNELLKMSLTSAFFEKDAEMIYSDISGSLPLVGEVPNII